jgi:hypothetical protein
VSDDTQQVKRLLADLRYPTIPEYLADRVDAAVRAEAAARADGEAMRRAFVSSIARPELAREAAKARAESRVLHQDVAKLAGLVGETEHAMATTLSKLASQNPAHAELLGELSRAATLGERQATALQPALQ